MASDPVLRVKTLLTVDDVEEHVWSALCASDDYQALEYLRMLESAGLDCSFRFFVAEAGGRPVGYCFGYVFPFPVTDRLSVRVLVTGSPSDIGNPFMIDGRVPEPFLPELLAEARRSKVSYLLIRDLFNGESIQHPRLRCLPLFSESILRIRWTSFEQYLNSMRSPYRRPLTRLLRMVDKEGYRIEKRPGSQVTHLIDQLLALWLEVYQRHPEERDQIELNAGYLDGVLRLPGTVMLLAYKQERLVAFMLLLERGSTLNVQYCGLDYEVIGRDEVYRTLLAHSIRHATEGRFAFANFGVSNDQVKARFGCELRDVHGYLGAVSPLARLMSLLRLDRLALLSYTTTPARSGSPIFHESPEE